MGEKLHTTMRNEGNDRYICTIKVFGGIKYVYCEK